MEDSVTARGYVVMDIDGEIVNKPFVIELDDLALHIEAGAVDITTFNDCHKDLYRCLLQKLATAAATRRTSTLTDVGTTLASGLLASLLFLIGF